MISNLRYSSGQASLVGDRHNNQDRCILLQSGGVILLGLADGMGGHPRGEAAAQILMDSCNRLLQGSAKPIRDPRGFLTRTLREAHEEIQVFGLAQKPVIDPRTTAVVALVQGNTAYWAHAGDSHFHLSLIPRSENEAKFGKSLLAEIASNILEMGGTIAAEHGLGKKKLNSKPSLHLQYGEAGLEAIRRMKAVLDPAMLLNPGNLI